MVKGMQGTGLFKHQGFILSSRFNMKTIESLFWILRINDFKQGSHNRRELSKRLECNAEQARLKFNTDHVKSCRVVCCTSPISGRTSVVATVGTQCARYVQCRYTSARLCSFYAHFLGDWFFIKSPGNVERDIALGYITIKVYRFTGEYCLVQFKRFDVGGN